MFVFITNYIIIYCLSQVRNYCTVTSHTRSTLPFTQSDKDSTNITSLPEIRTLEQSPGPAA